ncbi:MAG: hypothetical protein JRH18_21160, partial [Deltaproteobacteria bacterium]|nr:hypothetical protein [Deltaproteobacteria bacterium]
MMKWWNKKQWLSENRFVLGTFLQFYDTAGVEILSEAGFDFVIIDLEHGTYSAETLKTLIITAHLREIVPVVRVKHNTGQLIMEPLDAGALGVQIPFICTATDVAHAVASAKYHPHGNRGMNPYVRATGYNAETFQTYIRWSNENSIVILQVEG